MIRLLDTIVSRNVPSIVPVRVPVPPVMLVPPRTIAAMTVISIPNIFVGWTMFIMLARITPVTPASTPAKQYTKNCIFITLKPARFAEFSSPPIA